MRVPIALLRQIVYPTSYRLPPLPRLVYPEPVDAIKLGYSSRFGTSFVPYSDSKAAGPEKPLEGNLPMGMYRFFHGARYKSSSTSCCRWCGTFFYDEGLRSKHISQSSCKESLNRLYRELRKDKSCVYCDKDTHRQKWGIPVCSIRCENGFKFGDPVGWSLIKKSLVDGEL